MQYSDKVMDHFNNPRNVGELDENDPHVGTGTYGSPVCGDMMKLQIRVDENDHIIDAKFKTFGCGSAIASSSLLTEKILGRSLDEALAVRDSDIARELELPPIKEHCSVLAGQALKAAIANLRGIAPPEEPLDDNADASESPAASQPH